MAFRLLVKKVETLALASGPCNIFGMPMSTGRPYIDPNKKNVVEEKHLDGTWMEAKNSTKGNSKLLPNSLMFHSKGHEQNHTARTKKQMKRDFFTAKNRIEVEEKRRKRQFLKQTKGMKNKSDEYLTAPVSISLIARDIMRKDDENDKKSIASSDMISQLKEISWDTRALLNKVINSLNEEGKESALGNEIKNVSFQDSEEIIEEIIEEHFPCKTSKYYEDYDTPDPSIPVSKHPCTGCGAKLHCVDRKIGGYIPSLRFKSLTSKELQNALCQRCNMIKYKNSFIKIDGTDVEMENVYETIRNSNSLVLLLIDLLDINNTILRNSGHLFGTKTPVYVIGNKVDLIPNDGTPHYLNNIKSHLDHTCLSNGVNVQKTFLVSSKSGFGIEKLITTIMKEWNKAGHIYLFGFENCGKSTLFNRLLRSDLCAAIVRPLLRQATLSVFPGTTLSLLKFPVARLSKEKINKRHERLQKLEATHEQQQKDKKLAVKIGKTAWTIATLSEKVEPTEFSNFPEDDRENAEHLGFDNSASFEYDETHDTYRNNPSVRNISTPDKKYFQHLFDKCSVHDTPGMPNDEHLYRYLSAEELQLIIPKGIIKPRVFLLRPNEVMFMSGLGVVHYLPTCKEAIYVTVYMSHTLPVHIKHQDEADQFYESNVGTSVLGIPLGKEDWADRLPALGNVTLEIKGNCWWEATADVQVSSLGWISVTLGKGFTVQLNVSTPGCKGIYLRQPILKNFRAFQGKRSKGTNIYQSKKPIIKISH